MSVSQTFSLLPFSNLKAIENKDHVFLFHCSSGTDSTTCNAVNASNVC